MSDKQLSKNEQMVLYGLVKHPLLNDRELAEKLKLNISTLTAIKNRLKKREYYFTVRLPMPQNIGCELLGIGVFKLNLLLSADQFSKIEKEFSNKYPEAVYMICESDVLLCVMLAKNFTDMRGVLDEIKAVLLKLDAIEEAGAQTYFFPFQTTKIINLYDFGPILQRAFGIKDDKKKEQKLVKMLPEPKKLSRIEKIVYYGLIKYPNLPDKKIAEYTNVTRQVVARLRKEFEDEELIKTLRVPNVKKLGFQIISFAVAKINLKAMQELRKKGVKLVFQDIPTIFWLSGSTESFIISVMRDFDDYKDLYVKGFGHLKKYKFLTEMPEPQSLSINYMTYIKYHNYAPLIKKLFEITEVE